MSPSGIRLQKVLAQAGVASRRVAEGFIAEGRVKVNGETAILGSRVDPSSDVIELDGRRIQTRQDLVYLMLNKPRGVITTSADTHGRRTVLEMIDITERVYPVGRLDADSEGLLLLTNDGELANGLTHPSKGVSKTYVCHVAGKVSPKDIMRLRDGVDIGEEREARADHVKIVDSIQGATIVELVIHEGRKRVIRRMFEALGCTVTRLVRVGVGPVRLGQLAPGDHRTLLWDEVASLYEAAGLKTERVSEGER